MFFALSILFFVIFLLKPLSALSRDFVSYSVVVACNYVITSTSILFKALFHSQFVNNWRKSLTETFLLNFLSFFNVRSCPSSHFLTLYVRVCCEVWTANLYWSSWRGAYILVRYSSLAYKSLLSCPNWALYWDESLLLALCMLTSFSSLSTLAWLRWYHICEITWGGYMALPPS